MRWHLLSSKVGSEKILIISGIKRRILPCFRYRYRYVCQYSVAEGVSEVLGAYTVRTGPEPFMQNCSVNTQNSSVAALFFLTLFLFRNLYMIFMKSDCSVHLLKVIIPTVTCIEET
jgi:hypothetical protein